MHQRVPIYLGRHQKWGQAASACERSLQQGGAAHLDVGGSRWAGRSQPGGGHSREGGQSSLMVGGGSRGAAVLRGTGVLSLGGSTPGGVLLGRGLVLLGKGLVPPGVCRLGGRRVGEGLRLELLGRGLQRGGSRVLVRLHAMMGLGGAGCALL